MSSPIRITGMNSGLDTESIITALTQTKQDKLDTAKGDQKRLTWKQDKWKTLNKKVTAFYNGALSNMRFSAAYTKKTTTVSDESAATVVTSSSAMNTTQSLSITKLATAAYLTGSEITADNGTDTTMEELGLTNGGKLKFTIGTGGDTLSVDVAATDSISTVISNLESTTGLDFNFDTTQNRFYVASSDAGEDNAFHLVLNDDSTEAMTALGLVYLDSDGKTTTDESEAQNYVAGTNAEIVLNNVTYTSDSNTFEINGLTITANEVADNITLTTKQDTSGIYDNIKGMLKEYNELMTEFASLYNADSASSYKMLTDDQKDAMSDSEIEDWENKIKEGLLSKDETIGTVRSALRDIMSSSFEVTLKDNTEATYYLSNFGIATGSYFEVDEDERDVLHIDGDEDDSLTSGNEDKLSAMISTDPDAVMDFFTQLSKSLYSKLSDLMKGTTYSSSYTIYEDKLMASQYSAYTTKISDAQEDLTAAQDRLYQKFSAMETALSKINSNSSSLSSFFSS